MTDTQLQDRVEQARKWLLAANKEAKYTGELDYVNQVKKYYDALMSEKNKRKPQNNSLTATSTSSGVAWRQPRIIQTRPLDSLKSKQELDEEQRKKDAEARKR